MRFRDDFNCKQEHKATNVTNRDEWYIRRHLVTPLIEWWHKNQRILYMTLSIWHKWCVASAQIFQSFSWLIELLQSPSPHPYDCRKRYLKFRLQAFPSLQKAHYVLYEEPFNKPIRNNRPKSRSCYFHIIHPITHNGFSERFTILNSRH